MRIAGTRIRLLVLGFLGLVPGAPTLAQPTYNGEVAAILDRHCAECHRGGDVAPFPLTTFEQTRPRAREIARAVRSRMMPPWKPTGGFELLGDRRLEAADIETLLAWVKGGALPGDDADRPSPPSFPDGWRLGVPDAVLGLPAGYDVPARLDGDLFRNFVLDLRPYAGRYLTGLELRPLSREDRVAGGADPAAE